MARKTEMISVDDAKNIIRQQVRPLSPVAMSLADANGLVLAADVVAGVSIPGFRQSSMDGYAIHYDNWKNNTALQIQGVIPAGAVSSVPLKPGQAARIFTGAALPEGADTVVMQEKTSVEENIVAITDPNLQRGAHVREAGADIKAGDLAIGKNNLLTPAAIGFLTAAGVTDVSVYPRPTVSIVITGNELQQAGSALLGGQVYESNAITLKAALQQWQIHSVKVFYATDDLAELTAVMDQALTASDLVLISGGISVGDYDFVWQAAADNKVEQLFHTIRQRPAKPLYFGRKENTFVFGLPGNPASGLTSFYVYTDLALSLMCNRKQWVQLLTVPMKNAFTKPAGLTHFLKGWYNGTTVEVLDAQESYRLSSFARANCLIEVDADQTRCEPGEPVNIYLLPN